MNRKKVIAAAAFSAALAGGGVAGALLGAPTTSGAAVVQSESSASTSSDSGSATPATPDPAKCDRRGPGLDAAAAALGISADELRSAVESGKTIAQVASDKGVDVNTVIAAIAADEQKKIDERLASGDITQAQADQMKANATQHATDLVNGTRPKGGPGREGGHRGSPGAPVAPPADSSSSTGS